MTYSYAIFIHENADVSCLLLFLFSAVNKHYKSEITKVIVLVPAMKVSLLRKKPSNAKANLTISKK